MNHLAENLKFLRKLHNWSMTDVSKKSGVTLAYLSKIENKKQSNPSVFIVHKIAKAFQITIERLVFEKL